MAGVVPVAMAMHHLVERPARNLMKRVRFGSENKIDVLARLRLQP
jgi:peptidoglycan/LPS O-acetylase OafA/YrhL